MARNASSSRRKPVDVVPAVPVEIVEQTPAQPASVVLRDDHGRLVPGTRSLNPAGRAKGRRVSLSTAVARVADAEGIDFDKAVDAITRSLLASANRGDPTALRLCVEHLMADEAAEELAQQQAAERVGPTLPESLDEMADWLEGLSDLRDEVFGEPETPCLHDARMKLLAAQARFEAALAAARRAEDAKATAKA